MRTCICSVQVVAEVIVRMQHTRAAMVAVAAMPKVKLQSRLVRVTQSLLVKLAAAFRR
jgi:predicted nucleic acid-binding protein